MRTIGFVASSKENERRRALLPDDVSAVRQPEALVFEEGYGAPLGIGDSAYLEVGCRIAPREAVYECEVICNPKTPEPSERPLFGQGQTLFGWLHAVQGREIVDFLVERRMTGIAWEDMFNGGRHCFWRNNEIAGEAAVLHAVNYLGYLPSGASAAVIGTGNCARGAIKALSRLGVEVKVYDRQTEGLLREELPSQDIVVNAVIWDVFRSDHLIARNDLQRMKRNSMIIDISCDEHMGIESSHPTPIYDPVYEVDGVLHYAVDHTPALYYRSATASISRAVSPYLNQLIQNEFGECLQNATAVRGGEILDDRIVRFQGRAAVT